MTESGPDLKFVEVCCCEWVSAEWNRSWQEISIHPDLRPWNWHRALLTSGRKSHAQAAIRNLFPTSDGSHLNLRFNRSAPDQLNSRWEMESFHRIPIPFFSGDGGRVLDKSPSASRQHSNDRANEKRIRENTTGKFDSWQKKNLFQINKKTNRKNEEFKPVENIHPTAFIPIGVATAGSLLLPSLSCTLLQ